MLSLVLEPGTPLERAGWVQVQVQQVVEIALLVSRNCVHNELRHRGGKQGLVSRQDANPLWLGLLPQERPGAVCKRGVILAIVFFFKPPNC